MKRSISILAALAIVLAMGASSASAQDSWTGTWEVQIVNLTTQQVMTPFLLATHSHDAMIFYPGTPASEALEALAEGGDTMPLKMALEGMSSVMSVETGMAMTPCGTQGHLPDHRRRHAPLLDGGLHARPDERRLRRGDG